MTDDTRKDQQLTLADLCQALEDGRVDYTLRDGCYQVKPTAVRRLRLDLDTTMLDILPGASGEAPGMECSA